MATIDEDLGQIERDIRQLKIEYDQYFGGGRKRPPTEIEWRIDLLMKRYAERGGDLKSAQRFRFNNLTQTYAKYKDIFRKRMKQKEEGFVQRHFGAAARAIEEERAREHAKAEADAESSGKRPTEREAKSAKTAAAKEAAAPYRTTFSEPDRESAKVDELYQAFVAAKEQAGEETERLSRERFDDFVRKKTRELQKQKKCKDVEYVVETVDGQVKLKALVKA